MKRFRKAPATPCPHSCTPADDPKHSEDCPINVDMAAVQDGLGVGEGPVHDGEEEA